LAAAAVLDLFSKCQ